MDGSGRRQVRLSRWLLLVALVLGIAGMHTLGHLDGSHGYAGTSGMSGHAGAASRDPQPRPLPAVLLDALDGSHPAQERTGMPGFDPMSICLAVLTSFVFLLAVAWMWLRSTSPVVARATPVSAVARPPPRPTAVCLARLSVIRI
jgi:hypothetical protein